MQSTNLDGLISPHYNPGMPQEQEKQGMIQSEIPQTGTDETSEQKRTFNPEDVSAENLDLYSTEFERDIFGQDTPPSSHHIRDVFDFLSHIQKEWGHLRDGRGTLVSHIFHRYAPKVEQFVEGKLKRTGQPPYVEVLPLEPEIMEPEE
jgi:hypothetical protein